MISLGMSSPDSEGSLVVVASRVMAEFVDLAAKVVAGVTCCESSGKVKAFEAFVVWVVVVDMSEMRILMSCGGKTKSKKWKELWKTKAFECRTLSGGASWC